MKYVPQQSTPEEELECQVLILKFKNDRFYTRLCQLSFNSSDSLSIKFSILKTGDRPIISDFQFELVFINLLNKFFVYLHSRENDTSMTCECSFPISFQFIQFISLYISHFLTVIDFSSEKYSGSTGHRNSWYQ